MPKPRTYPAAQHAAHNSTTAITFLVMAPSASDAGPPPRLAIPILPLKQDQPYIAAVFTEAGSAPPGIDLFDLSEPARRITALPLRFLPVPADPADPAVIRGQRKRHALAGIGSVQPIPQPLVIGNQCPERPAGIERRGGISDASPGCGNGADNSAIIKTMRIVMRNLAMREPPFRGRFPISPMLTAPRIRPRRKPRPRRRGAGRP